MFSTRKRILVPAAIILSLALTPMLSGCGGLQGIVNNATGGKLDLGSSKLPGDFPKDVPVPSDKVIFGIGLGNSDGKVWNVTFQVASKDALTDIDSKMKGAGFAKDASGDTTTEATTGIYSKDPYGVLVVVSSDDKNGFIANYTVTYTKPGS